MTPRERVWAALRGEPVDRPPISFWGHFYHRESSAEDLVAATLEFHARHRWDWVKLNPRKHYHVEPWGVRYSYSGASDVKPTLESWPITSGEDWARIDERAHDDGALGEQLAAVRALRQKLPGDVPMIQTVFTPLAVLSEMVRGPQELSRHLTTHPAQVRRALEAVTATFERYARAVLEAGADGLFIATVDWGTRDRLSPEQYRTWARPWDERLLGVVSHAPFNVLHVCKSNNLLLELSDYPVAAFSWASAAPGNPSLRQALERARGAVMGGIAHEGAIERDDEVGVLAELRDGFRQTGGRRWLVAPSCSIPPSARPEQLARLRSAVERVTAAEAPT